MHTPFLVLQVLDLLISMIMISIPWTFGGRFYGISRSKLLSVLVSEGKRLTIWHPLLTPRFCNHISSTPILRPDYPVNTRTAFEEVFELISSAAFMPQIASFVHDLLHNPL